MRNANSVQVGAASRKLLGASGFDPNRSSPSALAEAAKSAISSAPEFCTENGLIFQDHRFGTKFFEFCTLTCRITLPPVAFNTKNLTVLKAVGAAFCNWNYMIKFYLLVHPHFVWFSVYSWANPAESFEIL